MHPNPAYRAKHAALAERLIEEIGFAMVFLTTPHGPRVAHTPILRGDGATIRFHLARANALSPFLDGATALLTLNGPDAYVSPRWYADRDTVPTWDYLALEIEGPVRRMTDEELEAFLHRAIATHEGRIAGEPWRAGEAGEATWSRLFAGIVGFEMSVEATRPTVKLSQKKSAAERERIAQAHEAQGHAALAGWMRAAS